jgi:hypothetical protein
VIVFVSLNDSIHHIVVVFHLQCQHIQWTIRARQHRETEIFRASWKKAARDPHLSLLQSQKRTASKRLWFLQKWPFLGAEGPSSWRGDENKSGERSFWPKI